MGARQESSKKSPQAIKGNCKRGILEVQRNADRMSSPSKKKLLCEINEKKRLWGKELETRRASIPVTHHEKGVEHPENG